ncbi:unnamed protein product [Rhizophagus irregularis]|nr:unnamed protein product [Rhizophagus irregularis]
MIIISSKNITIAQRHFGDNLFPSVSTLKRALRNIFTFPLNFIHLETAPQNQGKKADIYEEYYTNWIKELLDVRKIHYDPHDLKILPKTIGFGGSASVYAAKWKDTSTIYAIKKFVENKEVYLTDLANSHENIIQFRGITKLEDGKKYSLVLEYADEPIENTNDKFVVLYKKCWEHEPDNRPNILKVISELNCIDPENNNVLIIPEESEESEKTANSHLEEYYTNWIKELLDVRKIHYDPHDLKILPKTIGFGGSASVYAAKWKDTSTIYAIKKFVENKEVYLTDLANSHENIIQFRGITKLEDGKKYSLVLEYADEPIENTNDKFVVLYKKCWEHEPDNRPNILKVISELNCIDPENNNVLIIPEESEESEKTANVYSCQIAIIK